MEATETQARRGRLVLLAVLLLTCLAKIPNASASCQLQEIAEFQVELIGGSPVIEGLINDQPVRILVEAGSAISFITYAGARQLHLPISSHANRGIIGPDGVESVQETLVKVMKIGQLALKNLSTYVVQTDLVDANGAAVYQLGGDVLKQFTTEWDLAHGALRLFRPRGCASDQLVYWSPSYYQVSLDRVFLSRNSFVFDVRLNGMPMMAELGSGSSYSFITARAAREAGVEPGGPNAQPAEEIAGNTPKPIPTWIARFDTFSVGGETIRNAKMRIGALSPDSRYVRDSFDINLGADFLLANHLIIDPERHVAQFTYNGGAIFHPEQPK